MDAVEELFQRTGRIWHLHVGGQLIRTTGEHPFYVVGKGWLEARLLQGADLLCSHDGSTIAVEECYDTGEYEAVYNCRVAEWHTYYVGDETWTFDVWAHNTEYPKTPKRSKRPATVEKIGGAFPRGSRWAGRTYNFQGVKDPELQASLQAAHPGGVKFDAKGFPDFTPYLHSGGSGKRTDVRIEMSGSYREDFARANRAAGFDKTPDGYVWHHHQDMGRMQLVRADVHDNTRHIGGVNFWEFANGVDYRR
ncbi:MAG: HNH endonuclease [Gemmataceae bacterium]